jgi:mono/diheme cytochrome c family protein
MGVSSAPGVKRPRRVREACRAARCSPAPAGSAAVQSTDPTSSIRVILRGARTVATQQAPTGPAMPSFAAELNDVQVAAIVTYIRNTWGNAADPVSASRVTQQRASLARQASD